jgi:hypothetical protein
MCVDLPATAKRSDVESDDMTTLYERLGLPYSDLRLALPYGACATTSENHSFSFRSLPCHLQRFRTE